MDEFGQVEIPSECVDTSLRCAGLADQSKAIFALRIGRSSFRLSPQERGDNAEIDPKWEVPADPRKSLLLHRFDRWILAEFWGMHFKLIVDSSTGDIEVIALTQDRKKETSELGSTFSIAFDGPNEDSTNPGDLPGFNRILGVLTFTPLLEPTGFFIDDTRIASMNHPLNTYLWKEIENRVESEDSGVEWLWTGEGLMIENWLGVALMNSGWAYVLFCNVVGKDLADDLLAACDDCVNNGRGLLPTLALDPWKCEGKLYSAAEEIESCFHLLERNAHIFIASICLRKGYDISELIADWSDQEWTEEVDAVNNYCKSANE